MDDLFHYDDDPSLLQVIVHVLLWLAVGTLVLVTFYYLCRCACGKSGDDADDEEEERQVIVRQYSLPTSETVPGTSSDVQNFRILQEYEYLEFLEWQQKKKQNGGQNYQSFSRNYTAQQMAPPPGYASPSAPPPPYSPPSEQHYIPGSYVQLPDTTNESLQRR